MRNSHCSWGRVWMWCEPSACLLVWVRQTAEGSRIARVAQHFEHGVVLQGHPMEFTCMRTDADTAREEEPLVAKILHRGPGGPGAFEGGKQQTESLLDLGIRIEDDGLVLCVDQADRQGHFQR